ncbi:MAG: hypothetical protein JWM53_3018 [bacterium]|nr:hypothetical protein [bacterium]
MNRPLANDEKAVPFDVPADARVWRVAKQKARRGHPEPLYTPEGKPLDIPIDTDHEELAGYLDEIGDDCEGKYRFTALDSKNQVCCDTFGYARLSAGDEGDGGQVPRNAAAESVRDGEVAAIASALETLSTTIKELIEQSKQRDAETMKTLRQTIETLTVSNSAVSQTLARGYGDEIRPVRNPVDDDGGYEPDPAPIEAPPEDKVQQLMAALPQILSMIEGWQKLRNASAPSTPPNDSTGANGANGVAAPHGFGIHPNTDGSNGSNGGKG